MPHAPSEFLSAPTLAADLGLDVRTLRARVSRGDVPPPSRMIGNRPEWRRAEIVSWLRTLAAELQATSDLVTVLTDIQNDKTETVEGRRLAADVLHAVINGADPSAILAELGKAGR